METTDWWEEEEEGENEGQREGRRKEEKEVEREGKKDSGSVSMSFTIPISGIKFSLPEPVDPLGSFLCGGGVGGVHQASHLHPLPSAAFEPWQILFYPFLQETATSITI